MRWLDALKGGAKFTRVPHGVEHIDNLTALRVYVAICRFTNNTSGECWKSQASIAAHLNIGEKAVGKACKWLEGKQYIRRVRVPDRTGWGFVPHTVADDQAEKRNTGVRLVDENGNFAKQDGSREPAQLSQASQAIPDGSREASQDGSRDQAIETTSKDYYQTQIRGRELERKSVFESVVGFPKTPKPIACPHCDTVVPYLHSIPGRPGRNACGPCAEKYRAA